MPRVFIRCSIVSGTREAQEETPEEVPEEKNGFQRRVTSSMATKDSLKGLQQPLGEKHKLRLSEEVTIQKQGTRAVVLIPFSCDVPPSSAVACFTRSNQKISMFFVQFETIPSPDLVRAHIIDHDEHAVLPL